MIHYGLPIHCFDVSYRYMKLNSCHGYILVTMVSCVVVTMVTYCIIGHSLGSIYKDMCNSVFLQANNVALSNS